MAVAAAAVAEWRPGEGVLRCAGRWTYDALMPVERALSGLKVESGACTIDAGAIEAMDMVGARLLQRFAQALRARGVTVETRGLQRRHAALLELIGARAPQPCRIEAGEPRWVRLAATAAEALHNFYRLLVFTGEAVSVFARALRHPRRLRVQSVIYNLYHSGYRALPIIGMLSFLIGVVIAYQGAVQLHVYGADIFVADLISYSMLRELAPMMTAIIVAGRSGSAYTAQIGTMKVTEEIDALRAMGIHPMEVLVIPKGLALFVALPLLTMFADVLGVVGGMVMVQAQVGITMTTFLDRFQDATELSWFLIGIGKAPVFALIIALVGCYQGFQTTGGAEGVGERTTRSVVHAIFLVIVTDALFSVYFSWLGI